MCPKSGLLKRIPRPPRRKAARRPVIVPRYIRVGDAKRCILIAGLWHLVAVRPLPAHRKKSAERDVVLHMKVVELSEAMACKQYGAPVYAFSARALSKRELKQLPVPVHFW